MKILFSIFLLLLCIQVVFSSEPIESSDVQIARIVRQAVRDAEPELLKSQVLAGWREYLKLAAMDLDLQLQPLVLIKFDEDIRFRKHLRQLIESETEWEKTETEYFIYYYRWDQPLPGLILEVQDVHYKELARLFAIELAEKIPYRYDLSAKASLAFPFDDLRGGIVSPQPFDLEVAARAIFSSINSELKILTHPLARIYGRYFQNPSTAQAYYEKCLDEIDVHGYVPASELFQKEEITTGEFQEWYSAYAFTYQLSRKFDSGRLKAFLVTANCNMRQDLFLTTFEEIFGLSLNEFEVEQKFLKSVNKL